MSSEGGDDDLVSLSWIFHRRCNGRGRGGFDVKAHLGHLFLGAARFIVCNCEDVAPGFADALAHLCGAGGFGNGNAFGDGLERVAGPVGRQRGAMGGLNRDEFGQAVDQVCLSRSANPMYAPMSNVPLPVGMMRVSGALNPRCSQISYARVLVP